MEITTLSRDVDYSFKEPSEILIIKDGDSYVFYCILFYAGGSI